MSRRNRRWPSGHSLIFRAQRVSLAYPFGSRSEETRQIALELGTQSMLEVEGVNSPLDPTRIGRIKLSSD